MQHALQVGVANDVIPLFGGQTREFAGAEVHSCNCKRNPQMSVNLGKSCPIVLSVSAAMKTRIHLPSGSDIT